MQLHREADEEETTVSQQLRQVLPRHHRRAFGHGAMTAALVIVPVHSARARTTSAQGDAVSSGGPGSRVVPGGIHAVPDELPWMVRLSTGDRPWVDPTGTAVTSTTRRPLLASVPAYRSVSHLF
ncbi:hypothetical protein [Kribbella sp. NPDC051718]|uniref:hypothetical protein n=1 Tax=Kribbella sp. NPDC051718 TaxID=3155168 RepID=UPI0034192603